MDANGFALIVGAGSGIGLEAALTFAERGARGVALADKNLEAIESAAEKSKAIATAKEFQVLVFEVDVTKRESVKAMIDEVQKTFGRIDYAVNSAGIPSATYAKIQDVKEEEYDLLHNVNCKGLLNCLAEEVRVMAKQEPFYIEGRSGRRSVGPGSIINITSIASLVGVQGGLVYGASKFAARGVVKSAALENRKLGLRINDVCPSYVATPMMDKVALRAPEVVGIIQKQSPLGRMAVVEEVAGLVHFLATPGASYITGQSFVIDSGVTLSALM